MTTPLSVAVQGVGFDILSLALQGFGPLDQPTDQSTGGGGYAPYPLLLPMDLRRLQQLDEDELIVAIICAAVNCGLLENQ